MWIDDAGFLHRLTEQKKSSRHRRRVVRSVVCGSFDAMHKEFQADLQPKQVDHLAHQLRVSPNSLRSFQIGWKDSYPRGYSFPIRRSTNSICGLQIRTLDGAKLVVRGSSTRGMFIAAELAADRAVFVTEGVSDACSLATLGFQAMARFSKTTLPTVVGAMVRQLGLRTVVLVADIDEDDGGRQSAIRCAKFCRNIVTTKLLIPPAKDVREWIREGASRKDVIGRIRDV